MSSRVSLVTSKVILRLVKHAIFAVWSQMSPVELLDRYSKIVSQAAFSMLNLVMYYFIKTKTSPMKPQIDNDDVRHLFANI